MDLPAVPEDPLETLSAVLRAERAELARVARREGLGAEDAIDCVQDALYTFLQIAQRGELPEPGVYPAFLAGIVRNAARNKRRLHHLARPHRPIDEIEPRGDALSGEALIARAEEHVRLRASVDQLCDTQKAVVTLRLLEEQCGEDVAAALGISRGHVDVLLHRAKASLRACLLDD
jgi:RNA polymerase sigma-70 factor (ECF subfamily)